MKYKVKILVTREYTTEVEAENMTEAIAEGQALLKLGYLRSARTAEKKVICEPLEENKEYDH